PEGVTYNREKRAFLTSKVNSLFEPIAQLNCITGGDKEKRGCLNSNLGHLFLFSFFRVGLSTKALYN
ncbi:hypothetical protein, partial [Niastella populi]|uniref:hypothetical protein n=1 Tax=Niastella populi TaxID=550983 RepID=UPI001A984F2C